MRRAGRVARVTAQVALVAFSLGSSACGYALAGRGSAWPATIKRVGIPDCLNQSGYPDVDRIMTDAIRVEFSGRGKFTIVPEATGVDALVTCTITGFNVSPNDVNQQHQAVSFTIRVSANIEAHDLTNANKVLWQNPAASGQEPFTLTNSQLATDATAAARNDTDAMDRLARDFARNVVSSMLEAF